MKIETYLDAMEEAFVDICDEHNQICSEDKCIKFYLKRKRQYKVFRKRIIQIVINLRGYETLHNIRMGNFR